MGSAALGLEIQSPPDMRFHFRLRHIIAIFFRAGAMAFPFAPFLGYDEGGTEEFLMAGRSMGTLPMTLSLVASFMSAITLLGTPAEMYVSG